MILQQKLLRLRTLGVLSTPYNSALPLPTCKCVPGFAFPYLNTLLLGLRNISSASAPTWSKFSRKIVKLDLMVITEFLDSFWAEKMERLDEDVVVLLIVKIGFKSKEYRSFSRLNQVNKSYLFKVSLLNEVEFYYNNYYDNYSAQEVELITINYRILGTYKSIISTLPPAPANTAHSRLEAGKDGIKSSNLVSSNIILNDNHSLPKTMDLYEWNQSIIFNEAHTYAHFTLKSISYTFELTESSYICTIRNLNNQKILLSFKDEMCSPSSLTSFRRAFIKKGREVWSYFYKDGEIIYSRRIVDTRYMGA